MKTFQRFQGAVALPNGFGATSPYARLFYKDASGQAGADADVEYREMDGGQDQVVVTVSEWMLVAGQVQRSAGPVVTFSMRTGEIVNPEIDQQEDLAQLLTALSGMSLVRENERAAQ